jgi:integrase
MAKSKMKGVSSSTRNGVEYWYARVNGQKKYCGKGSKGRELAHAAKSKDVARSYENKEINAGMKVKRSKFKTVKDIINWYMLLPTNQAKKVYDRDLYKAEHVLKYFGGKPLSAIDPDRQEKYRTHRDEEGAASGTIDLEIAFLSKVYSLALKRKLIQADVLPGEFLLINRRVPRRPILKDEFESLLHHTNKNFSDFLICGYESGMRLSEIINLTAGKVHLDIQHISGQKLSYIDLGIFDTKTKTARNVPISPRLQAVLERRLHGLSNDDYVFTNSSGNKYEKTQTRKRLLVACKAAGVDYGDKGRDSKGNRTGIVFHSLRHTRITEWVKAGYSDEIIRMASGHKTLDAYRAYIHLDPSAVMRLVEPEKTPKRNKNGTKLTSSL